MRNQRAQIPNRFDAFTAAEGIRICHPTKDHVLIFLPGNKIRSKRKEQEDRQQKKDSPGDLMGTFIFCDLPGGHPGFLFRLQFARAGTCPFFDFSRFAMATNIIIYFTFKKTAVKSYARAFSSSNILPHQNRQALLFCWPPTPIRSITPPSTAQSTPPDSSCLALRHPIADLARTNLLTDLSDTVVWIYHSDTRNLPFDQLPSLPYHKSARHSDHFVSPPHQQDNHPPLHHHQ